MSKKDEDNASYIFIKQKKKGVEIVECACCNCVFERNFKLIDNPEDGVIRTITSALIASQYFHRLYFFFFPLANMVLMSATEKV